MAPPVGGNHRERLHRDYSRLRDSSTPTLHGWAGIEDHMFAHDIGMVSGYADDIDTLLVFAGLFSAILTAFVVQTYPMLQTGDTTNQLIALGVSAQLSAAGASIPRVINDTLSSFESPSSLAPSLPVRWINILFFLSLVSSLAAALFGILAKQWIREYLNWNAPLADPRENVLVRQMRLEGWEAWNVEATIAAIPALLEFAMVLFLVGIVTLLWTLDDVVAVVVTVVVSIFLGIVSTFTVFPIIFRQCPYKSPTAWVCLRLCDIVRDLAWILSHPISEFYKIPGVERWAPTHKTWRARDLAYTQLSKTWWNSADILAAAGKELARERVNLKPDGSYSDDVDYQVRFNVSSSEARAVLRDILEASCLLRALSWVRRAAQDTKVRIYIEECLDSIHHTPHNPDQARSSHLPALTTWYLLLAMQRDNLDEPLRILPKVRDDAEETGTARSDVTYLRRQLQVAETDTSEDSSGSILHLSGKPHVDAWPSHLENMLQAPLILGILASDLKHMVAALPDMLKAQPSQPSLSRRVVDADTHLRRIYELVNALLAMTEQGASLAYLRGDTGLEPLRTMLCDEVVQKRIDERAPGLRVQTLRLVCLIGRASVEDEDHKLVISAGTMEFSDYESLLLRYPNYTTAHRHTGDDLDVLIFIMSKWLAHSSSKSTPPTFNPAILDSMNLVADELLLKQTQSKHSRLRGYDNDRQWIQWLFWNVDKLCQTSGPRVRRLLHTLEKCFCQQLLTSRDNYVIRQDLHYCLQAAHEVSPTCEEPDCHWLSHKCDGRPRRLGRNCQELDPSIQPKPVPRASALAKHPSSRASLYGFDRLTERVRSVSQHLSWIQRRRPLPFTPEVNQHDAVRLTVFEDDSAEDDGLSEEQEQGVTQGRRPTRQRSPVRILYTTIDSVSSVDSVRDDATAPPAHKVTLDAREAPHTLRPLFPPTRTVLPTGPPPKPAILAPPGMRPSGPRPRPPHLQRDVGRLAMRQTLSSVAELGDDDAVDGASSDRGADNTEASSGGKEGNGQISSGETTISEASRRTVGESAEPMGGVLSDKTDSFDSTRSASTSGVEGLVPKHLSAPPNASHGEIPGGDEAMAHSTPHMSADRPSADEIIVATSSEGNHPLLADTPSLNVLAGDSTPRNGAIQPVEEKYADVT